MKYFFIMQRIFFVMFFYFCFAVNTFASSPNFSDIQVSLDSKPNIGADVEKSIVYLFSLLSKENKNIDMAQLEGILRIAHSTVESGTVSIRDRSAKGAFLRENIHASIEKVIPYQFANGFPTEVIQPAGARSVTPLKVMDTIPNADVKSFLDGSLTTNKVYFEEDREESTPDIFTGASYSYPIKKMRVLLPKHKGKRIALIVNQQTATSTISTKSVILGDDQNWNYIYSTLQGSADGGASWVKSHIYDSAMILLLVENPTNNTTDFIIFKWLRAGWLRVNVVSSSHIYRGTKRVVYSINKVLSSPHLPSVDAIQEKYNEYKALSEAELRKRLAGYSKKVSEYAIKNPILKTSEWTPFVADGKYVSTLNKTNMLSLLIKNYVKEKIGVPTL